MKPIDFAKALGVALLVLAIDLFCAFCAVWFYALVIEPGHPTAYYTKVATPISTVSTMICGPILFALFIWLFSRRRPDRNPFAFALVTFLFYYVIDGALVGFQSFFFSPRLFGVMAIKLSGAMIGAWLAWRGRIRG